MELVTIEDIQSEKWKVDIEIPLIYTHKDCHYELDLGIMPTDGLVRANADTALELTITRATEVKANDLEPVLLQDYIDRSVAGAGLSALQGGEVDLGRPGLQMNPRFGGVPMWLPITLTVVVSISPRRFLKYLEPEEYSQLRDHVRKETLPLHARLSTEVPLTPDETWVELRPDDLPDLSGLWLDFENWTELEINAMVPHSGAP